MNTNRIFTPALFKRGRRYTFLDFKKDTLAGLSVGVIAIPLCIAFGIKAGFSPAQGLLAGIISALISAFLSGSNHQISGPTAACIGVTASLLNKYGIATFMQVSLMAGVILIVLGLLKTGNFVIFVSKPIIIGFTASIAISIFFGQLPAFIGIRVPTSYTFLQTVKNIFNGLNNIDFTTTFIGLISLALIYCWPKKICKIIPASLMVMTVGAVLTTLFSLKIDTIGSIFNSITMNLNFSISGFGQVKIINLIMPAFTLSLLIAFTSLLSSAEGDRLSFTHHNANTELISQGGANIVLSMFGLMPTTGAVARTVTNIRAGANTQISNIMQGLTILLFAVFLKDFLALVPMTSLAGILISVSFKMVKYKDIKRIFIRGIRSWNLFIITLVTALLVNLVVAVVVGITVRLILLLIARRKYRHG